jgi:hypothetical protein
MGTLKDDGRKEQDACIEECREKAYSTQKQNFRLVGPMIDSYFIERMCFNFGRYVGHMGCDMFVTLYNYVVKTRIHKKNIFL